MKLIELRDKINEILEKTPSWGNCERIGIVQGKDETGFCDMEWLEGTGQSHVSAHTGDAEVNRRESRHTSEKIQAILFFMCDAPSM